MVGWAMVIYVAYGGESFLSSQKSRGGEGSPGDWIGPHVLTFTMQHVKSPSVDLVLLTWRAHAIPLREATLEAVRATAVFPREALPFIVPNRHSSLPYV